MNYLCISNQGEVDPVGLKLMGASSKDASKIGTFGTGWKYGMAVALRLAGPFTVCSGTKVLEVSSTTTMLRGQPHQELTIEGVGIGITDQLGKGWEPWMCVREFVSNAIDEGSPQVHEADAVEPEAGMTKVYLPMAPFAEVFANLDDYFRLGPERDQVETDLGRTLPRRDQTKVHFYKKGVLVKVENGFDAAHDYELNDLELGEDRIAKDWRKPLWAFLDSSPPSLKEEVVTRGFEAQAYGYGNVSKDWLEAFQGKLVVQRAVQGQDCIVVPWAFLDVAERVGARTLRSDRDARAAMRKLEPASPTVKQACKAIRRIGIDLDHRAVLMADMDTDYVVEGGVVHLRKSLSEAEVIECLILSQTEGYGQERKLAQMVRKLAKL